MNVIATTLCMLGLLLAASSANAASQAPDAQTILADVVARLPQDTLEIGGDLITRKPRGVVLHTLRFDMQLDWGATPALARYTIRDGFGASLEQLILRRTAAGHLDVAYAHGDPLTPAPAPPLMTRIQQTDLSWTDLSLDFLWWPDGRVAGAETIRGRECHIVEVPAPASGANSTTNSANLQPYAFVRLWVEKELSLLMQAEAYNSAGIRVRRLWVRSLKKQGERWMIKDLEVQAYPPVQRTRLHVNAINEPELP